MSLASALGNLLQQGWFPKAELRARSHLPALGALAALLFAMVSGCGEDDCEPLGLCDIRERSCQEDVANSMACMRGSSARLAPVEVISEDMYRTLTAAEPSEEDAVLLARYWRGLSLFRLSEASVDPQAIETQIAHEIAGAYLPKDKRVVVIDRGVPMRSVDAVLTLAHEMVHAMQYAEHDIEALYGAPDATFDSRLALRGLIEGEATHYTILARLQLDGHPADDLLWQEYYREWQQDTFFDAESDAQPLELAYLRFPYAFGGMFATEVWLARGPQGLSAMFDHPPRRTRELLFGPAAVDLDSEQQALDARGAPVMPMRFERVSYTHLGAWIGRMFTARMGVPISDRLRGPQALASDVFSIYRNTQTEQVVASWRVRLLPGSAQGIWPSTSPLIDGVSDPDGRELYLVAQQGGSDLEADSLAWEDVAADDPPPSMPVAMVDAQHELPSVLPCMTAARSLERFFAHASGAP